MAERRCETSVMGLVGRRVVSSVAIAGCYLVHTLKPRLPAIKTYEPALANRAGVVTVWTDGSGRHSSDPLILTIADAG
eukprot:4635603-Amphidinium_carterae.1